MSLPHPMDLSAVRRMDAHVVHPWESFDIPNHGRTVLGVGEGSYVFDAKGNRLLDGPGGMWCVNAGHGQKRSWRRFISRRHSCPIPAPGATRQNLPPGWLSAWRR